MPAGTRIWRAKTLKLWSLGHPPMPWLLTSHGVPPLYPLSAMFDWNKRSMLPYASVLPFYKKKISSLKRRDRLFVM